MRAATLSFCEGNFEDLEVPQSYKVPGVSYENSEFEETLDFSVAFEIKVGS